MSPVAVGHSGFTGPGFVGPVGVPYVTSGTATFSAGGSGITDVDHGSSPNVSTISAPRPEYHVEAHIAVKPKYTQPTATPVHGVASYLPLESGIAFVAFGGAISTGTAFVWHRFRHWRQRSDA